MSAFDDDLFKWARRIRGIGMDIQDAIHAAGGDIDRVIERMQANNSVVLEGLIIHLLIADDGNVEKVRERFVQRAREAKDADEHP